MCKKQWILALIAALMVIAAGCGGDEKTVMDTEAVPASEESLTENGMQVVDREGVLLGTIDARAACSAVDAGLFYSVFEFGENAFTADAEYHLFSKDDHSDVLLGTFDGQGYEAAYTRTELNGRIYTLAVRGKAGEDDIPLVLLSFDPARKTMETFTISETGFPYTDMAAADGKLLIMNHEMSGRHTDTVYEFDPSDGSVRDLLTFSADTDSLRGICAAENGFYLLRLKIGSGSENEMFVDRYDEEGRKVSELSVNEIMAQAIMTVHGIQGRADALNEIGMNIAHFSVLDDRYMLYENFGLSRICVDLETGKTLFAGDDLYAVSTGNGSPVVYRMGFDGEHPENPDITGFEDGTSVRFPFTPTDSHRLVRTVSRSEAGTWAVVTSDSPRAFEWTQMVRLWTE